MTDEGEYRQLKGEIKASLEECENEKERFARYLNNISREELTKPVSIEMKKVRIPLWKKIQLFFSK